MVNFQPWVAPADPFEPLNEAIETGHVALTSDALKSGAEQVERLIIRGPGRLEWRLPGPVDPRSMLEAEWRIGGERGSDSVWPSDSVVLATWTERVAAAPDSPSGQGMPVRLGPLKGCASGSHSFHLEGHWTVVPSSGDVRVVGLLADPLPDAPFQRTEFVRLYNASDRTVDAGGWHWGGARLTRRRLMAPGETHRFEAGEFVGWPGLANAGGTLQVTTSGGHPVASFSWSPCSHSREEFDGRGVPLVRGPAPGGDWHSEGHLSTERAPQVVGYGCLRDWTGQVHSIEVYLSSPAGFQGEMEWFWVAANGEEVPMVDEAVPDAPNAIRLSRQGGEAMVTDWPIRTALIGHTPLVEGGSGEHGMEGWNVQVSCPPAPLPDSVELRVAEALWAAEDGGGEFVEVENRSPFPIDLRGLQATREVHPLPSDWDEWVEDNRSLVLQAGEVMAFGRCPRWYRMGHGGSWTCVLARWGMVGLARRGGAPLSSPALAGPRGDGFGVVARRHAGPVVVEGDRVVLAQDGNRTAGMDAVVRWRIAGPDQSTGASGLRRPRRTDVRVRRTGWRARFAVAVSLSGSRRVAAHGPVAGGNHRVQPEPRHAGAGRRMDVGRHGRTGRSRSTGGVDLGCSVVGQDVSGTLAGAGSRCRWRVNPSQPRLRRDARPLQRCSKGPCARDTICQAAGGRRGSHWPWRLGCSNGFNPITNAGCSGPGRIRG